MCLNQKNMQALKYRRTSDICSAENLKIRFCPTQLLICRTFCLVEYFYFHKNIFSKLSIVFSSVIWCRRRVNYENFLSSAWLPQLRMSLHLKFTCFALFQWMVLMAGTLYLKILSGAPKKLLDKVSVSWKYLVQGLICISFNILY